MKIVIIVFVMAFILFIIGATEDDSTQKRGKDFEKKTAATIRDIFHTVPFQNLLIPNGDIAMGIPGTSELDMVFVTSKGIFCVECKSHIGNADTTVSGSLTHDMWRVEGRSFDMFRNPFMQNEGHIKYLEKVLAEHDIIEPRIYNTVVLNNLFQFSYFGTIISEKDCYILPHDNKIILTDARGRGFDMLQRELSEHTDIYTEDQMEIISTCLKQYVGSKNQRKKHIMYVHEKYGSFDGEQ